MNAWSLLGARRSDNFLHEMSVSSVKQLPGQAWPCKLHTGCSAFKQPMVKHYGSLPMASLLEVAVVSV